jgi:hypothetical protein
MDETKSRNFKPNIGEEWVIYDVYEQKKPSLLQKVVVTACAGTISFVIGRIIWLIVEPYVFSTLGVISGVFFN